VREKRRRKSRLVVMPHVLYHHSVRVKRFLFCTSFRTRKSTGTFRFGGVNTSAVSVIATRLGSP
jgi:hypothetical protein